MMIETFNEKNLFSEPVNKKPSKCRHVEEWKEINWTQKMRMRNEKVLKRVEKR